MKEVAVVACVCVVTAVLVGCNAPTRYEVLSVFFDGVPTPAPVEEVGAAKATPGPDATLPRRVRFGAHGPYAAKLCTACHESIATNKLAAPREQLCFRCHEFKLDKKYIHGPLASGGCLACHDPHSSQYRYLLVSESDDFCLRCHNRDAIMRAPAHAGVEQQCTGCHDAHMSDKKYLLK
jgi:predicted CXXCH cytochrome family protein